MSDYQTITLVSRNIDCSNITADEFMTAMFSDLLEAEEKYNELYTPEYVERVVRSFNSFVDSHRKQAIRYAEKKWKTEKKRNEYINKQVEEARNKFNPNMYFNHIAFFDLDVWPESNGISGNCVLSLNELTFGKLHNCYETIKDNYYFKNATGWELKYECHINDHATCFRPYIELILSEKVKAEYEQAEKDLSNAIHEFYKGCTYWGD